VFKEHIFRHEYFAFGWRKRLAVLLAVRGVDNGIRLMDIKMPEIYPVPGRSVTVLLKGKPRAFSSCGNLTMSSSNGLCFCVLEALCFEHTMQWLDQLQHALEVESERRSFDFLATRCSFNTNVFGPFVDSRLLQVISAMPTVASSRNV
jgi:hypothetical protein